MKTFELNVAGLESLHKEEVKSVNGGAIGTALLIAIVGGLIVSFVNNFGDVREGFSDGYAGKEPRH